MTGSDDTPPDGLPTLAAFAALPKADRDAAYNNGAAVARSAEWLAAWREASNAVRAANPEGLDVRYGPRERNLVDFFAPRVAGAPTLVFVHGGYWQRNAKEVFTVMVEGVRAAGWGAALPGYTLCPEAKLAEIVAEIRASLDVIATRARGPIVLSGWSAGGHLAAQCLDHPLVKAGLSVSGVFDLAPLRETYLNEALRLCDEEIATLSPMNGPVVAKPFLVAHGEAELPALIANSRIFHAKRARAGAAGALIAVPGADHFSVLEELSRPEGVIARSLLRMMA